MGYHTSAKGEKSMRIIYVDDEMPAHDKFRVCVNEINGVSDVKYFLESKDALEWGRQHKIDVAFLDIEMPCINGIELARQLKEMNENISIFFVTAYENYALDAFSVKALGYLLKPYTSQEVAEAIEFAERIKPKLQKRVKFTTMPSFVISIDGEVVTLSGGKKVELLALLVEHAEAGLGSREAISYLWPDRPADKKTQTLLRVTMHQLNKELEQYGIEELVVTKGRKKYINKDLVDCDLYRVLEGKLEELKFYAGEYMKEYSWAETRNAQLMDMKY